MSYTPTNWQTGDIVSSQRLNKLEEGVKDAYEVMVINDTNATLDKTWQEIYDAMAQGKLCVIRKDFGDLEGGISINTVNSVALEETKYMVVAGNVGFSASSATGYPALDTGGLPVG